MKSIRFAAAALLLAASCGAYAQQAPQADFGLRMDRGFYIAVGAGHARADGQGCVQLCDVSSSSWNASAGYQFNRNFGAEIGYVDLGESTVMIPLIGGALVPATTKAKAIELLGVATLPLTEKFGAYLKAGIYRSDSKSTSAGIGGGAGSGKENDTGFTFGVGVQYSITPNLAARFEWQNYNDVGTGAISVPPADINVWRLGARYKF